MAPLADCSAELSEIQRLNHLLQIEMKSQVSVVQSTTIIWVGNACNATGDGIGADGNFRTKRDFSIGGTGGSWVGCIPVLSTTSRRAKFARSS